jgi:hypothetical protein
MELRRIIEIQGSGSKIKWGVGDQILSFFGQIHHHSNRRNNEGKNLSSYLLDI